VNIGGNKLLPNGINAKIWLLRYPNRVDSNFVYQAGDTVKFLFPSGVNSLSLIEYYIVPLVLNNVWLKDNHGFYDSVKVVDQGTIGINNQVFENSFFLYEDSFAPNVVYTRKEWFCPYIGVLTRLRRRAVNNPFEEYIELVQYQLQ
jgi:hypothetical protein